MTFLPVSSTRASYAYNMRNQTSSAFHKSQDRHATFTDGILEDCSQLKGQLEDKKS